MRRQYHRFALLFCFTILLIGLASVPLLAQAEGPQCLLEIPIRQLSDLQTLAAAGLDVAGVNRSEMTAGVVATPADFKTVRALGFEFRVKDVAHPLGGPGEAYSDYTDPQEMSAFLDKVQAAHPTIAKKVILQDTLFEGQKLLAMKITADVESEHDRPVFLLDGQHHANEIMGAEVARDAIDYLTSRYETDPRVKNWVDHVEIWVVPIVNPDGSMYVFTTDNYWRKNRHPNCGVDLNRNYGWNWNTCQASGTYCLSDTYHGSRPYSEPETQGMKALMDGTRPLFYLTYHSYGEFILYPLGCSDPDEMAMFDAIAQALNRVLENDEGQTGQYVTGPAWSALYKTDGTSDDDAYGRFGTFTICLELNSTGDRPDYATWRDVTVQRQRAAWQFLLDETLGAPSIRGHVTNQATGLPLQAQLSLQEVEFTHGEAQRRADGRGAYAWVTQADKTYHGTFSFSGFASQTHEVAVGTGPSTVDVALVPSDPAVVPSGPSPADGAANQPFSVTLNWQGSGTSYDVYFGTSSDPPHTATVSGTSWSTPALDLGGTYHWRVATVTEDGPVSGPLWSFGTCPYQVTGVAKRGNPFRLTVTGTGFKEGCKVLVDGKEAPETRYVDAATLEAGKGKALKAMVPAGVSVQVAVVDADGGASPPFMYQR